jgi:hypothetical protein
VAEGTVLEISSRTWTFIAENKSLVSSCLSSFPDLCKPLNFSAF